MKALENTQILISITSPKDYKDSEINEINDEIKKSSLLMLSLLFLVHNRIR